MPGRYLLNSRYKSHIDSFFFSERGDEYPTPPQNDKLLSKR